MVKVLVMTPPRPGMRHEASLHLNGEAYRRHAFRLPFFAQQHTTKVDPHSFQEHRFTLLWYIVNCPRLIVNTLFWRKMIEDMNQQMYQDNARFFDRKTMHHCAVQSSSNHFRGKAK